MCGIGRPETSGGHATVLPEECRRETVGRRTSHGRRRTRHASQWAMDHMIKVGRMFDAEDFVVVRRPT